MAVDSMRDRRYLYLRLTGTHLLKITLFYFIQGVLFLMMHWDFLKIMEDTKKRFRQKLYGLEGDK